MLCASPVEKFCVDSSKYGVDSSAMFTVAIKRGVCLCDTRLLTIGSRDDVCRSTASVRRQFRGAQLVSAV